MTWMTRDGFWALAMTFTGQEAASLREKIIAAQPFDLLGVGLVAPGVTGFNPPKTIEPRAYLVKLFHCSPDPNTCLSPQRTHPCASFSARSYGGA